MDAWIIAGLAFTMMFASAVCALICASRLPDHHLTSATQDTVKLGVGMIAAVASLILGLMVASLQSAFNSSANDVRNYATSLLSLDLDLRRFGPGACAERKLVLDHARTVIDETWTPFLGSSPAPRQEQGLAAPLMLNLDASADSLKPLTDAQHSARKAIEADLRTLVTQRWQIHGDSQSNIPTAFLVVLIVWLALIFGSFGLFAPPNALVVGALFLCSLSIAGALFLIVEMASPFDGLIQVSSAPMREVVSVMERQACSG